MRVFRQVASVIAVLVASVLPAQAQNGQVTGRVVDAEDGRPIADASVVLVNAGRRAYQGFSKADGSIAINAVAAGTYDVAVTKIGYSPRRVLGVVVKTGAATRVDVSMTQSKTNLQAVSVTTGRKPEKTMDAPAQITTISSEQIRERPAVTVADNLKSVPGLDISTGGIVQSNIVSRGFNNAFSGSMLMLQDYRFAGVPSLRVNVPFLFTGTNEDIERIEVLNGPASALYGPNSGSGALHIITRSPFSSQGTTVSLDGGQQSIYRVGLRTAHKLNDYVAVKLSGELMAGKDFQYQDLSEPGVFPAGTARAGQTNVRNFDVSRQTGEARMDIRPADDVELITTYGYTKVGSGIELTGANGSSQIKNWTYQNIQQRFRWGRLFAQAFMNSSNAGNESGTDQTGTFLLRSGQPIVDQSSVWSAQIQHGFAAGDLDFTYGGDYIKTTPVTKNTINGRNEDRDNVTEYGGYVQGSWKPTSQWEILGAIRTDHHSVLDTYMFSPRAAILFKPDRNQTWRLTYNRAFSTPANFTFFLDLLQATNAGGSGFNVRAVGNSQGWQFDRTCAASAAWGTYCMRSPYAPGPGVGANAALAFNGLATAFKPALTASFTGTATSGLTGALTQALIGAGLPAATAAAAAAAMAPTVAAGAATALGSGTPTSANIPTRAAYLTSPTNNLASVADIAALKSAYNETFELGWKGTFGNRFSLDITGWSQLRRDIGSSAAVSTPSIWMDAGAAAQQAAIGGYIGGRLGAGVAGTLPGAVVATLTAAPFNLPLATATAIASGITAPVANGFATAATPGVISSLARAPLGTVPFNDPLFNSSTDVLYTYITISNQFWLYGADAAWQFQADDNWTISGTIGGLNKNVFPLSTDVAGQLPLMANSPKLRSTLTVRWAEEVDRGFSAEVRGRYTDAFQVNSGVYNTGYCNTIAPGNPGYVANSAPGIQALQTGGVCPAGTFSYNSQWGGVPVNLMADIALAYKFELAGHKALWSLTVNNALDNKVPTFAGAPAIGRLAMTRLSYSF